MAKYKLMVMVSLLGFGCSAQRVSLRQVQEYDMAVRLAETRGLATDAMYVHLGELMSSYARAPGVDPLVKAQQDAAAAMQMQAVNGFIAVNPALQQQRPEPPLTFGQWQRAR